MCNATQRGRARKTCHLRLGKGAWFGIVVRLALCRSAGTGAAMGVTTVSQV